jgi:5-methyltetrahydropteroyltriglutamate--homocysteine methyltransferase
LRDVAQQGLALARRRRRVRRTISRELERLAISPQCGFASTVAGNPLTEADERAKLALVVQAAGSIWN